MMPLTTAPFARASAATSGISSWGHDARNPMTATQPPYASADMLCAMVPAPPFSKTRSAPRPFVIRWTSSAQLGVAL